MQAICQFDTKHVIRNMCNMVFDCADSIGMNKYQYALLNNNHSDISMTRMINE